MMQELQSRLYSWMIWKIMLIDICYKFELAYIQISITMAQPPLIHIHFIDLVLFSLDVLRTLYIFDKSNSIMIFILTYSVLMNQIISKALLNPSLVNLRDQKLGDFGINLLIQNCLKTQSSGSMKHETTGDQQKTTQIANLYLGKMVLKVDRIKLTGEGMKSLPMVRWGWLSQLTLEQNRIGDKGCKYLAQAHMPVLLRLNLSANNIGDCGMQHLSRHSFTNLLRLQLSSNLIKNLYFLTKVSLSKLVFLNLKNNKYKTQEIIQIVLLDSTGLLSITIGAEGTEYVIDFFSEIAETSINSEPMKKARKLLKSKYEKVKIQNRNN